MEGKSYVACMETGTRLRGEQKLFKIIVGKICKSGSSSRDTHVLVTLVVSF